VGWIQGYVWRGYQSSHYPPYPWLLELGKTQTQLIWVFPSKLGLGGQVPAYMSYIIMSRWMLPSTLIVLKSRSSLDLYLFHEPLMLCFFSEGDLALMLSYMHLTFGLIAYFDSKGLFCKKYKLFWVNSQFTCSYLNYKFTPVFWQFNFTQFWMIYLS
jgi:hypothetical protein